VADQGPGVPPDERDRVWQPFMRGSTSVRRGVGGSGIGLTIVRQVVERHGGRTWVGDADGGGAAFAVEFPLPPAIRTASGIEATNGAAMPDGRAAAESGANDAGNSATDGEAQAGHHPRESSDTLSGV
jgi:hypothetical protein